MKCPRCVQRIHRAASSCPHCGFSLGDADGRYGSEEVRLRCLTDSAGILRRGERERVESAMERISQRFPQVFVAIYTGSLGEVSNLRQFGFWLLNRSAFEDLPPDKPNEAGILISIDPESKAAGMVFGYLLDPFLDESDTFDCLSRAHAYWLEGRYADGIVRALAHLENVLVKKSRHARRDPEHFQRKVLPPAMMGDLVRRIRDGHRAPARLPQPDEEVAP
ncbi:MAG: TPM domain-containing protein [Akkermansiaceae bacterium]|nr:TPM domain-containing protein [Akkermansiaceae bacterium]MCP5548590.1 TPM domain-containing protein [Akkermansiaceae bacterium]